MSVCRVPATVAIGKDDDVAALTGEMATGARCRYSQRRRCVEAGDWWKEGGTSSFKYQRGETPDTFPIGEEDAMLRVGRERARAQGKGKGGCRPSETEAVRQGPPDAGS
jgi:hypothetical protein